MLIYKNIVLLSIKINGKEIYLKVFEPWVI